MHYAARDGNLEMALWLLTMGGNAKPRNSDGNTPAMLAESKGHKDLAEILKLSISPPKPPSAPMLVGNPSDNFMVVEWKQPDMDPQIPQITEYSLQVGGKFFGSWTTKSEKITDTKYKIEELNPDTKYIVRVRAKNVNGWGEYSPNSSEIRTAKAGVKSKEEITKPIANPLFKNYKTEIANNNLEGVKSILAKHGGTLNIIDEVFYFINRKKILYYILLHLLEILIYLNFYVKMD